MRDICRLRLRNQRVMGGRLDSAVDAVGWLGGVQSQEYPYAKWTLGMRVRDLFDADVDALLAEGAILRTHILRPTWHFVLPADLRWMMALTAPRIWNRNRPPPGMQSSSTVRALASGGCDRIATAPQSKLRCWRSCHRPSVKP